MGDGSYAKIGYETKIGRQRWAGPVIATPDALYCVLAIGSSTEDLVKLGVGGALLGPLGGAIAGAMMRGSAADQPMVTTVGEAPEELRRAGTGPIRRFKAGISMLVVPRQAVTKISKSSWINNTLHFTLGEERIVISHNIFIPSRVREHLAATGWPVEWRGQSFNLET